MQLYVVTTQSGGAGEFQTGRSAAENFCSVLPSRSACAAKLYTSPRYCAPDDSYVFSVALSSLSCAWLRLSFASQSFSKL